jgi:hypothetical protein
MRNEERPFILAAVLRVFIIVAALGGAFAGAATWCAREALGLPDYKRWGRPSGGFAGTDVTPPELVGEVTFPSITGTSLVVDWPDATGEPAHYIVIANVGFEGSPLNCETGGGEVLTGCDEPTDSTCTVTGLTQMTSYAFTVCAVDEAGNISDPIEGWEQPFADEYAVRFGHDPIDGGVVDGAAIDGGAAVVTNEFQSANDNAVFESPGVDGGIVDGATVNATAVTVVVSWLAAVCVDGTNCDDFVMAKGPNSNITMDILLEFGVGGGRTRNAYNALGQWGQVNAVRSDGTSGVLLLNRVNRQANTFNGLGTGNDGRLDVFHRQCDGSTPPVCDELATDMTAGLGACGTAPCFLGTLPQALDDRATSFFVGGVDATSNFNLVGWVNEIAAWRVGKVTADDVSMCVFDGTSGKFRNLLTMSKRTNTGGTPCDQLFPDGRRMYWLRGGDGEVTCAGGAVIGTNWFQPGQGDVTSTNMECGDRFLHGL